jgi:hypothetical protein
MSQAMIDRPDGIVVSTLFYSCEGLSWVRLDSMEWGFCDGGANYMDAFMFLRCLTPPFI